MSDNHSVTKQRKARGKIITTDREVAAGGTVDGRGDYDAWHCWIDFAYDQGLLGSGAEGDQRRSDALRFRELWVNTHPSQRSNLKESFRVGDAPVSAEEIGDNADCMKQEWHLVLKYLKPYIRILQAMCLTNEPPTAPINLEEIERKVRKEAKAFAAIEQQYLALLSTRQEYGRQKERRSMQESLIKTHILSFRLSAVAALRALDALPEALQRARKEADDLRREKND